MTQISVLVSNEALKDHITSLVDLTLDGRALEDDRVRRVSLLRHQLLKEAEVMIATELQVNTS